MCTCIYCVFYCLYCVFVLVCLCFVSTSVRITATELQLNCSSNDDNKHFYLVTVTPVVYIHIAQGVLTIFNLRFIHFMPGCINI